MAVERQLVGFFVDCLHHDYLRMKVMRDNPDNFQYAVQAALNGQNLRKDSKFDLDDSMVRFGSTTRVGLKNRWT